MRSSGVAAWSVSAEVAENLFLLASGRIFSLLLMSPPAFLAFRAGTQFGFGSLPRLTAVGGVDELVDKFCVVEVAWGSVVVINISSLSLGFTTGFTTDLNKAVVKA